MATNSWDLMRELASMQDRMNRMWRGWSGPYDRGHDDVTSGGAWTPPVDIYESTGREIVLKAELPGLKREDIDLTVENNTLTVRGERRQDPAVTQQQYHRSERSYGAFSRSFTLPTAFAATARLCSRFPAPNARQRSRNCRSCSAGCGCPR